MNIFAKVLTVIVLIALIFKFTMIPGAGILLVLSLSLLAFIYLVFGFAIFNRLGVKKMLDADSYKEMASSRLPIAIGLGIAFAIVCAGMLFKLQYWPEANVHLRTGLVILTALFLFNLVKYFKTKGDYYRWISLRVFFFGLLGVILISTSSLTIVKIQYRNHPRYIQAYEAYEKNPSDAILIESLDIEQQRATMSNEDFQKYLEWTAKDKKRKLERSRR